MIRYVIAILILFAGIGVASADYTIGDGGSGWVGNASFNGTGLNENSDPSLDFIFDAFDDGSVSSDWTQVNPDGNQVISESGGNLVLTTDAGSVSNLLNSAQNQDAPRVIQNVSGNFMIEANLTFYGGSGDKLIGLLVYNDTQNFYVFGRGVDGSSHRRWKRTCIGNSITDTPYNGYYANTTMFARIVRNGNSLKTYYADIDKYGTWVLAFDDSFTITDPISVGIVYFDSMTNAYAGKSDWCRVRGDDGNLTAWHDAGSNQETYQITVNCTTQTNTNYTVYYRQNNTGNYVSLASAQTGNTTTSISGTKYQNTDVRVKLLGNTTHTPELLGITFGTQASAAGNAPSITSYAPTGNIWPEVQDSQLFNVTVNQTTQCRWYVNGTLKQTNSSLSLTHTYTNSSLNGGGCNVTAVANNTNGDDSQTWEFEVGADSISYTVLSEDDTNLTCLIRWNMVRVGSNMTSINTSYVNTTGGYKYCKNFDNDTEILNQTAASDDETLWFNSSTLLPTGIYYINGSCPSTNEVTVYTNEWTLLNIWEIPQTFQQIAANVSNITNCVYFNSTSGLFEEYRAGYTYNHDTVIPANCSIFVLIDESSTMPTLPGGDDTGNTTESITPTTGGITIIGGGRFYGYLPGTIYKTLSEIETGMNADGLDVWHIHGWDNATQEYTSTGSYSVAPNEGYVVHVNVTGEYTS